MKHGKIVLYREWLCTVCGTTFPYEPLARDGGASDHGRPTGCFVCKRKSERATTAPGEGKS